MVVARVDVSTVAELREVPGEDFRISRHPINFGPRLTELLNQAVPEHLRSCGPRGLEHDLNV